MLGNLSAWLTGARSAICTGCAVAAFCLPVGYCAGRDAAKSRADAERAAASVQALNTARTADEVAGVARVNDALEGAAQQEELTDAISTVPDTLPDDTRVALGCERLRRAGTDTAAIPACTGPDRSDGAQAAPAR
jgi:hypothetical protein